MISAFFDLLKAFFTLGGHVVSSIEAKVEDNKEEFTSKLNQASANIRSKCGIPKDSTDNP